MTVFPRTRKPRGPSLAHYRNPKTEYQEAVNRYKRFVERRQLGVSPPPEGCNPEISTRGLRELFCVNYRRCLDYSVREHWPGFDCGACQCSGREKHVPVATDSNY